MKFQLQMRPRRACHCARQNSSRFCPLSAQAKTLRTARRQNGDALGSSYGNWARDVLRNKCLKIIPGCPFRQFTRRAGFMLKLKTRDHANSNAF